MLRYCREFEAETKCCCRSVILTDCMPLRPCPPQEDDWVSRLAPATAAGTSPAPAHVISVPAPATARPTGSPAAMRLQTLEQLPDEFCHAMEVDGGNGLAPKLAAGAEAMAGSQPACFTPVPELRGGSGSDDGSSDDDWTPGCSSSDSDSNRSRPRRTYPYVSIFLWNVLAFKSLFRNNNER